MKSITILISFILSLSLFAQNFNDYKDIPRDTKLEAGLMLGHVFSSGLTLEYSFNKIYSIRTNGYFVKISKDDLYYNLKLSFKDNIHRSVYGDFYLISSMGTVMKIDENDDNTGAFFASLGFGYKYKLQSGIRFFVEMEEGYFYDIKKSIFYIFPLPVIGIMVSF